MRTRLLEAAAALAPDGVRLERYDDRDVPLYDADLAKPAAVAALERAVADADAVLLAVPEYNHSLPGVLKNTLDWISRPAYRSVLRDKPVGVISAAASFVGGARGQQHTKTILLGMGSQVFPWPELLVGNASQRFDAVGLTDPTSRELLTDYLQGFAAWVARVRVDAN